MDGDWSLQQGQAPAPLLHELHHAVDRKLLVSAAEHAQLRIAQDLEV